MSFLRRGTLATNHPFSGSAFITAPRCHSLGSHRRLQVFLHFLFYFFFNERKRNSGRLRRVSIWASVPNKTFITLRSFTSKMVAPTLLRALLYEPSLKICAHLMHCNKELFIERFLYSLFIAIYVEFPWESARLLRIQPFLAVLPRLAHRGGIYKVLNIYLFDEHCQALRFWDNKLCLAAGGRGLGGICRWEGPLKPRSFG